MKTKALSILLVMLAIISVFTLTSCDQIMGMIPGMGGGNPDTSDFKSKDMKAVYQIYSEYTTAEGKTPLSFDQWFVAIGAEHHDPYTAPVFRMNKETDIWEISYNGGDYNGNRGVWFSLQFKTITAEHKKCDHSFSDWTVICELKENTYAFSGISRRDCSICGYKDYKFRVGHDRWDINDPEHQFVETVHEGNCIEGGFSIFMCECGMHYDGNYTEPLGHDYIDLTFNATCTEWGYTYISCSRCNFGPSIGNEIYRQFSQRPLGHDFEDGVCTQCGMGIDEHEHEYDYENGEYVDATCTEHAYTVYTCIHCDYSYKHYRDRQEPYGHFYQNGHCGRCGEIEEKNHQHSYQAKFTLEPTCEGNGYTLYVCDGCGQSYEGDTVSASGHKYENEKCTVCGRHQDGHICDYNYNVMTFESYCMFPGYTASVCKCGNYVIDSLTPLADHTYQNGYCVWCVHKEGDHIHKYSDAEITKATCEEALKVTLTCSCGHSYSITGGEPLRHDFEDGGDCIRCGAAHEHNYRYSSTVIYPTCTEQGYTLHECPCGESYKDNYKDPLGHYYSDDYRYGTRCVRCDADKNGHVHSYELVSVVDPTCTDHGYHIYTCPCGDVNKSYSDPPLGHEYESGACIRCGHIEGAHEHSYSSVSTQHPNCTTGGETTYYCDCGYSYTTDYTAPLGHDYVNGICSRCGRDENQHEHSYTATVTPPTCAEQGYTTYTCQCGDSYQADFVPPTEEHTPELAGTTPPTCTEFGYIAYSCTVCGYPVPGDYIDPLGHDYVNGICDRCGSADPDYHQHSYSVKVIGSTCTDQGYTAYDCICGDSYIANYTDPLGHDYVSGVCSRCGESDGHQHEHSYTATVTPPTCTAQGYTTYTCQCGDSYTENYTEPVEHSFGEWTIITEATCEGYGHSQASCTVCGETTPNPIPPLGHNYVNGICLRCGSANPDYHQHSYSVKVIDPTCTDRGYTAYDCICGDSYIANYTDPLGHDYVSGVCSRCGESDGHQHNYEATVTEPTCTAQGYTTYTCHCGDFYTSDYTEPQHNYQGFVTEPGCALPGCTTYTCTICGNSYMGDFTNPLGCTYTVSSVTAPTCTEEGYTTYNCIRCGSTRKDDYIAPLGHSYGEAVTEPTCTEGGYITFTCTDCGDTYQGDYTAPLGHSYEEKVTEPTCTEQGYTTYTCTSCGDTYQDDYIEPNGHNYEAAVTEPSCTEQGYTTYICSVCGDTYDDDFIDPSHSVDGDFCSECGLNVCEIYPDKYFTFTSLDNGTYSVKAKEGADLPTNVVIPAEFNGKPVTAIDDSGFSFNEKIVNVIIPDSVTSIGNSAFMNCSNLVSVKLPSQLTEIPDGLFLSCMKLAEINIPDTVTKIASYSLAATAITELHIPEGVTFIGGYAIAYNENLTEIYIPKNVTEIGWALLVSCSSLTSVTVDEENTVFHSDGNCIIETATNTLISGCKSSAIPDYVTRIDDRAFEGCKNIISVVIPDSVTSIGDGAFVYCYDLKSIFVPDSVISVDEWAFATYSNVEIFCEAASQPEGWKTSFTDDSATVFWGHEHTMAINTIYPTCTEGGYTTHRCLTCPFSCTDSFTEPKHNYVDGICAECGVEDPNYIPYFVFTLLEDGTYSVSIDTMNYGQDLPTNIVIPDEFNGSPVTVIAPSFLSNVYSVNTVTIPSSIKRICYDAFSWSSVSEIVFEGESQLEVIESSAFMASGVGEITIPKSVRKIESQAFAWCYPTITLEDGNQFYHIDGNCLIETEEKLLVTAFGDFTIPSDGSVTAIEGNAFHGMSSLTEIYIPNEIESIGGGAFSFCQSLTSVVFEEGSKITTIEISTFMDTSLTSFIIPESVTSIEMLAFEGNHYLTEIFIPESVISIGNGAFGICSKLTIYCVAESQPEGWASNWNPNNRHVVWGYTGE